MKKSTVFLFVVCMSCYSAHADDAGKHAPSKQMQMPSMTSEQRQKMADAHEKMAICLRSDKPVSSCREEMKKACQEGMGKEECSMMHEMMPGKSKGMHPQMMHENESDSKPAP
jgi:hypothetical protein